MVGGDNSPSEIISGILTKADVANERLNCFITICQKFALDSAARLKKKLQIKQAPGRLADYYEQVATESQNPHRASGWILTEVLKALKDNKIEADQLKIGAKQLGQLIKKIDDGTISGKIAKDIFAEMIVSGREVGEIIAGKGLVQISDEDAIGRIIREVINENEDNVRLYQMGKTQLLTFFVGQVMAKTGGRANPQSVNRLLKEMLDGEKT